MSFLSIPSEEGLFTAIQCRKSEGRLPVEDELDDDADDDDDEDDDTNVHLIPRCSPVPRKRGQSIHDETEEYMRIQQALPAGKRVSFADATGGDLVDVREFAAGGSEDEDSARWEEEEAKYRKPQRAPTYRVRPEFRVPAAGAPLLRAVRENKVEVEHVSQVEREPLAFSGVIRVLNVSYHKAVYVRSTMDGWESHVDHPAEYVQGSHDGDTDRFSFKISFAPPYVTHGSRIEFVVRYETSEGDFWANNSSKNYAVTLLLSLDDDSSQRATCPQQIRGILKPPKAGSVNDDFDSDEEQDGEEEEVGTSKSALVRPTAVYPVFVQPEIDVEITAQPSGSFVPPAREPPPADVILSVHAVPAGGGFPRTSPETAPPTDSAFVLCASESAKSQPLPRLHCELGDQTSERPVGRLPFAPLSASSWRSDGSPAGGEETPPPEASGMHLPTAEAAPGEDGSADSPTSGPGERVSRPSKQEVAEGLSELAEGLSEGSTRPAARSPAARSPAAESQASPCAKCEAPASPELTENSSVSAGVAGMSRIEAPQSVSAWEEKKGAPQIPPDAFLENLPNTRSEVSELRPESDIIRILMPAVVIMSGAVSLYMALQDPSVLFLIGLLLALHRF